MGFGISLHELVKNLRSSLKNNLDFLSEFESKLESSGFKDSDTDFYQENLILSDLPVLILIDKNCPRITKEILGFAFSDDNSSRISDVEYRINFDGLGFSQGTDLYKNILGEIII